MSQASAVEVALGALVWQPALRGEKETCPGPHRCRGGTRLMSHTSKVTAWQSWGYGTVFSGTRARTLEMVLLVESLPCFQAMSPFAQYAAYKGLISNGSMCKWTVEGERFCFSLLGRNRRLETIYVLRLKK